MFDWIVFFNFLPVPLSNNGVHCLFVFSFPLSEFDCNFTNECVKFGIKLRSVMSYPCNYLKRFKSLNNPKD